MLLVLLLMVIFLCMISYFWCKKDLLAPAVLVCMMYIVSISFALISQESWNSNYQLKTIIILLINIISFVLPSLLFFSMNIKKNKGKNQKQVLVPINVDKKILIFLLIIDIVITLLYVKEVYRISLLAGNNIGIKGMANYFRSYMVKNTFKEHGLSLMMNQCLKLSRALGYVSIFIFSYNYIVSKKLKNNLIFLVFGLIMSFQNLIGGGRGYILWLISLGFSVLYYANMKQNFWNKSLAFKYIKIGIILFIIMIVGFYFAKYYIRIGNTNNDLISYISYYAGGSIHNFDMYLKNPQKKKNILVGQETFMGILTNLSQLGLIDDIKDVYVNNSNLEYQKGTGNVYGAVRRYYNDFGIIGVVILQIIVAIFYSNFYERVKEDGSFDYWNLFFYSYLLNHLYMMPIDDNFYKSYLSFNMFTTFFITYIVYFLMVRVKIQGSKIKFNNNRRKAIVNEDLLK